MRVCVVGGGGGGEGGGCRLFSRNTLEWRADDTAVKKAGCVTSSASCNLLYKALPQCCHMVPVCRGAGPCCPMPDVLAPRCQHSYCIAQLADATKKIITSQSHNAVLPLLLPPPPPQVVNKACLLYLQCCL